MEDKFDIHTILRMLIPGYIWILVVYSFGPEIAPHNVSLLALLGIPIGFIIQAVYRFIYISCGFQNRLFAEHRKYMVDKKGLLRNGDSKDKRFTKEDNCYYTAAVDYLIYTQDNFQNLRGFIAFSHSRMHSVGKAIVAIVSGVYFVFLVPIRSLLEPVDFTTLAILWIAVAALVIYVRRDFEIRLLEWRKLIIDQHTDKLKAILEK